MCPWYPPAICSLHKTLGKAAEVVGSGDKSIRGKTPNLFPRTANVHLTLPFGKREEGERENKMKKEVQEKVSVVNMDGTPTEPFLKWIVSQAGLWGVLHGDSTKSSTIAYSEL